MTCIYKIYGSRAVRWKPRLDFVCRICAVCVTLPRIYIRLFSELKSNAQKLLFAILTSLLLYLCYTRDVLLALRLPFAIYLYVEVNY